MHRNALQMSYTLLKALHIIFVVTWFAGLFYMFRLFVYHREAQDQTPGPVRDALIARASLIVVVPTVARRRRLPAACTATGLGRGLPKI